MKTYCLSYLVGGDLYVEAESEEEATAFFYSPEGQAMVCEDLSRQSREGFGLFEAYECEDE